MNVEKIKAAIQRMQVEEARRFFEAFGRIEKVFVNGGEVKPWHIDAVLIDVVRNRERLKGIVIQKINGVCSLRVALQPIERKRRGL